MSLIITPYPFEILSQILPFGQWNETWEGIDRDDENSLTEEELLEEINGEDNADSPNLCDNSGLICLRDD